MKQNNTTMKNTNFLFQLLLIISLFVSLPLFAQHKGTGIGTFTPDPSSSLDVKSEDSGVLIPRVSGLTNNNATSSIKNPANGLLVYDKDKQCLSQNIGTPEAANWICISGNVVKFFYMPSIALDITITNGRYNLFELYKEQFSNPVVKSDGAPSQIPFFGKPQDLYYYVTSYSDIVFEDVKVSTEGILTYRVKADAQINSDSSDFMNIVFVVK